MRICCSSLYNSMQLDVWLSLMRLGLAELLIALLLAKAVERKASMARVRLSEISY